MARGGKVLMVRRRLKNCLFVFLACGFLFISGCDFDFLGIVAATDLDARLAERNNFNFLTPADRETSFGNDYSFIVLTDIHIENGNAHGFENLKGVIASNSVKFVVVLGDITDKGSARDIDRFIDIAGGFGVPCYPVIGNHDIRFGNWSSVWKNKIGSTSYRINGGGTTLFVLDSANSFFGKEQLDWLEKELSYAHGRVFVFTHAPLFATIVIDQITDIRERACIISILRNRCEIMFMGHSHQRTINTAGNVRYINIEDFRGSKVYCLVSVKSTGVTYTFKNL